MINALYKCGINKYNTIYKNNIAGCNRESKFTYKLVYSLQEDITDPGARAQLDLLFQLIRQGGDAADNNFNLSLFRTDEGEQEE